MTGKNVEDVRKELISLAGLIASRFSFSPIAGQIYALCYFSEKPVSLNDMVQELKISKGSASTNIRALENWGAVKKVWVNSDRKDYYEANEDILNLALRRIREGLKKRILEVKEHLTAVELPEKDRFFEGRLKKAQEILHLAENVLSHLPDKISKKETALLKTFLKIGGRENG